VGFLIKEKQEGLMEVRSGRKTWKVTAVRCDEMWCDWDGLFVCFLLEAGAQELLGLLLVDVGDSSGGGSRSRTTDETRVLASGGGDAGTNVGPSTLVLGLFLDPHDLGVGVLLGLSTDEIKGEGADLFNARQSHSVVTTREAFLTLGTEVIEDLSSGEDKALDLAGVGDLVISNETLEVSSSGKVADRRAARTEVEKGLWSEDDERLAEVTLDLTSQDVEEVGRRGAVGNLDVDLLGMGDMILRESEHVLIRELEEALRTTTAVLGALAFETVREEHGKAAHTEPLLLTRGDELIDDDLGSVAKVTELGLPDDEAVGTLEGVAVFEAEDSVLREGAVDDVEVALVGRDVLERGEGLLGLLAVDDGVTVVEGSALAILSGETHVVALSEEGAKGKSLSESPIEAISGLDHLDLGLETVLETGMQDEILGEVQELETELLDLFSRDSSGNFLGLGTRRLETSPVALEPVRGGLLVRVTLLEALVEIVVELVIDLLDLSLSEHTLGHELSRVDREGGGVVVDDFVHGGLGEAGLIELVVTETTVAVDVDDGVLLELLTVLDGDLGAVDDGFGIISVDVQHDGSAGLGDLGGVRR